MRNRWRTRVVAVVALLVVFPGLGKAYREDEPVSDPISPPRPELHVRKDTPEVSEADIGALARGRLKLSWLSTRNGRWDWHSK